MEKILKILTTLVVLSSIVLQVNAQSPELSAEDLRKSSINVFFDCALCDMNYIREEIPFINYVRDVKEAKVYIRLTRENTGSGGDKYTLSFEGLSEFKGMNDTLEYTSNSDETTAVIRALQVKVLKTGLMRYVARTPIINEIQIVHNAAMKAEKVVDNWDNWVFELSTSPSYTSDDTYKLTSIRNSANISRITPDFKLEIDVNQSYNKRNYINFNQIFITHSESIDGLFVKSLGEHWSAGLKWEVLSSTQSNYDFNHDFMPSIEYDLFPYSESTHRQFRMLYSIGHRSSNYTDTTIYSLLREDRFRHELSVGYMVQEKWGSINLAMIGATFLDDFSKNSIEAGGSVRIRIFKGLSFTFNANVGYINDAINLVKPENIKDEEKLLRLKQEATRYQVSTSVGLTYTFGSIYNNVVNPRFNRYSTKFYSF
ncbi:MAG TPA: hypothetical protein VHO50_09735 [Bacteroidales bacterium]|nr:hypothetical protein [Bacteroidales bacterium]